MTAQDLLTTSDAVISDCGRYRYWLTRAWGDGPLVTFVMLNPSIADAARDDPTIRRCVGYARTWGYAGLAVVNLYALVATNPRALWVADDPVGPENDQWLKHAATRAASDDSLIIAAWGANARPERVVAAQSLPFMDRLSALTLTKAGQPGHPLRLKADLRPTPFGVRS